MLLLEIDEKMVEAEIKYEPAENSEAYPHIYGALNVNAVTKVTDFYLE